ncbi:MAG: hypothetical protein Q9180_006391 [Flavoplaca navasiana]
MPQNWENDPPVRHNYRGNLATNLDPSVFGQMAPKDAESSKPASSKMSLAAAIPRKMVSNGVGSSKAMDNETVLNGIHLSKAISSKMLSNGAESSRAVSKQIKPLPPKTRQQKIDEALGQPPTPKGMIKDGKLTWTQPSTIQASSHRAASHQSESIQPPKPLPGTPAGSASQTSNFPCPYTDCKRGFLKEADLRKHKMQDHDYCKICDEDFEDDEAFHKHKIMSERHITCAVCSLDFRSESGRDRHYNVTHAASHNVKCRACDTTFAKGAALVLHFEKNLCHPKDKHGISADRFEAQRAAMAMVLQTKNSDRAPQTESTGGSLGRLESVDFGGSVAGSSVHGGVPIEASEQPDFLTDHGRGTPSEASDHTERPLSPHESDAETDLLSFPDDPRDALNASNLAALDQGRMARTGLADWPALGSHKDALVKGMSNVSVSAGGVGEIPGSPGIYAPPSVQPSKSGYSVAGEMKGVELQPNAITGEWECPYYKCNYKGLLRQDLEAHFDDRNNGHRGFEHQCPSCLKRFKTASAIIAHLESPTVRCTIRNSRGYNNILHLVSGGHLNVSGRHNDGTYRLVVPKDPAKTTESMLW